MADWTPLAEGDPLAGDPDGLGSLLALFANDAAELGNVLAELRKVDAENVWTGANADRFTAARDKVLPDLTLLADGMKQASDALRRCCPGIGNSQGLARTAVGRAREATANLTKANAGLDEAARLAAVASAPTISAAGSPPAPASPGAVWGPNWTGVRDEAQEELDAARKLFEHARQDYEEAVDRCVKDLQKILTKAEAVPGDTTDRLIGVGGEASLALLGVGTSWNPIGFGRSLLAKGVGRVSLMEGHLKKEGPESRLAYTWVKHDFLEERPLSKTTEFFKSVDDEMKPYAKGIQAITLASTAWGVFGKEHDRKDLSEGEAVVATAWKVGTEEGGSWIGGKVGAEAGAYLGGQFGVALIPVLGPAGPVVGAIGGGMVGAMAGSWAGKKVGKFVEGAGEGGLKLATHAGRDIAKGAKSVVKHLNPFG